MQPQQCSSEGCRNKTTLASGVCTSCTIQSRFPNARTIASDRDRKGFRLPTTHGCDVLRDEYGEDDFLDELEFNGYISSLEDDVDPDMII